MSKSTVPFLEHPKRNTDPFWSTGQYWPVDWNRGVSGAEMLAGHVHKESCMDDIRNEVEITPPWLAFCLRNAAARCAWERDWGYQKTVEYMRDNCQTLSKRFAVPATWIINWCEGQLE